MLLNFGKSLDPGLGLESELHDWPLYLYISQNLQSASPWNVGIRNYWYTLQATTLTTKKIQIITLPHMQNNRYLKQLFRRVAYYFGCPTWDTESLSCSSADHSQVNLKPVGAAGSSVIELRIRHLTAMMPHSHIRAISHSVPFWRKWFSMKYFNTRTNQEIIFPLWKNWQLKILKIFWF